MVKREWASPMASIDIDIFTVLYIYAPSIYLYIDWCMPWSVVAYFANGSSILMKLNGIRWRWAAKATIAVICKGSRAFQLQSCIWICLILRCELFANFVRKFCQAFSINSQSIVKIGAEMMEKQIKYDVWNMNTFAKSSHRTHNTINSCQTDRENLIYSGVFV